MNEEEKTKYIVTKEIHFKYLEALDYIKYLEKKIELYENELGVNTKIQRANILSWRANGRYADELEIITIPERKFAINKRDVEYAKQIIESDLRR